MSELTGFAVAQSQDEGLEIVAVVHGLLGFGEEPFHAVWSARWDPDPDSWARRPMTSEPPSGLSDRIAIAANHDGRLESVVVAEGDPAHPGEVVWHASQNRPGGDWSSWESLAAPRGTQARRSVLAQGQAGRLEVFTRTFDGKIWHRRQAEPTDGSWENWQPLDAPALSGSREPPAVMRNHRERLEVFTTAAGGLWHRWQTDTGWSEWKPLEWPGGSLIAGDAILGGKTGQGTFALPLALVRSKDGWLGALTIANDQSIWHRRQQPGGEWDQWIPFLSHPGWLTDLAAGTQPDGRMVLVAVSRRPDGMTDLWLGQEPPSQEAPGLRWEQARWKLLDTLPRTEHFVVLGAKDFSTTVKSPALVSDSQGRFHLFCQVTGSAISRPILYILSQQEPNSDEWEEGQMIDLARLPQNGQVAETRVGSD
jgi:hypothetical protein